MDSLQYCIRDSRLELQAPVSQTLTDSSGVSIPPLMFESSFVSNATLGIKSESFCPI